MPPEYRAMIMAGRPRLIAMAREQYGLELNQGPYGIESRAALVGAKYAEAAGLGEPYHRAVFRAYWQQAADIGDRETLAEIAAGVGLDREAFLAALDDPAHTAAVDADIAQAHAYGLNGVPALVFAERYLVSGAQPYPVLKEVTAQVRGELEEG
jgi:predicted DsbA family dithiol-disulfide isomerase